MRVRMLMVAAMLSAALPAGAVGATELPEHRCVPPPQNAAELPCLFDIWGYVYDADGLPFSGVGVSDGGQSDITGADGFYTLHELGFGTYELTASLQGCSSDVKTVEITIFTVLEDDGQRHDFHMPCRIDD